MPSTSELQAIVLAGGLGTRLRESVADLPKPLAPVNGRPFLNFVLSYLRRSGLRRVILATSYMHEEFEKRYGKEYKGLELDYSVEQEPLGTGGGLRQAIASVTSQNVLIINGDTFFAADIDELLAMHSNTDADLTIGLKPMRNISRYGIVKTEGSRVVSFEEKKEVAVGNINAGVYVAKRDLFDAFELPKKFSIEEDFLRKYTTQLNIHAHISEAYFIDIGIPADYQRAQTEMRKYE
jgi:D-glycero-alpha-D-manno-heptose 1-phosphate guanylyltransferase